MPEIDGNELLQWLAKQDNVPPIVLVSGYDQTYISVAQKLGQAIGAVIVDTLTKPLNLTDLTSILQEIHKAQF